MSTRSPLPDVNYSGLTSRPRKKPTNPNGLILFILLLLAGLVFAFRDRLSWYANVLFSEPTRVTRNTPNADSSPPASAQPKSKAKKLAEAGLPSEAAAVTTSDRPVRAPLSVEVLSGGGVRRTIQSHNTPVQINLAPHPTTAAKQPESVAPTTTPVNASALSVEAPEVIYRPVEPTYPRLAEQMKVQGAVILMANIDKEGNIQSLKVLSGPEILAAAAQQAVMKWRFKPHYKDGQPIETEARVVVNFVISTQ